MRNNKLVTVTLCLSLLLNAAGIVFFVLFLTTASKVKSLKKEKAQLTADLNMLRSARTYSEMDYSESLGKRSFVSHFDGEQDVFAISPPLVSGPQKSMSLLVYLHGMGSTYMEPFLVPKNKPIVQALQERQRDSVLISCSYRKSASWGSDAGLADVSQNIREVCQQYPISKIVMVGTSMGGSAALTYAATAPDDIKRMIEGVVSIESAGDLASLYDETEQPLVKSGLATALGGTPKERPQIYYQRSFLNNLNSLPRGIKVAVISATDDSVVPAHFQQDIVAALKEHNVPAKLIEMPGNHDIPDAALYQQGLDFVLEKQTASTTAPQS